MSPGRALSLALLLWLAPREAAAQPPSFKGVSGWGPLSWNMSIEQVRQALKKAGIPFAEGPVAVGMFPTSSGIVEASFASFNFEHEGWHCRAELKGGQLDSVTLNSRPTDLEKAAGLLLAGLERRFGPPVSRFPVKADPSQPQLAFAGWSNERTSLNITGGYYTQGWYLSQRYQRLPASWP